MTNLPIQSVPVHRSRITKGALPDPLVGTLRYMNPEQVVGSVSPSVTLFGAIHLGPFAREDEGVSQSISLGPISLGPFANDDAE